MTDERSPTCDCRGMLGFHPDPEGTGMWVHATCGRPTREYLASFYRQIEAEELGQSTLPEVVHKEGTS